GRPLAVEDVVRAAATASGRSADDPDLLAAAEVAEGSVRRALALLDGDALALRNGIVQLLERLPAVDPLALHALGDRLYGVEAAPLAAFVDTVNAWLAARLAAAPPEGARLNRGAAAWGRVNAAA